MINIIILIIVILYLYSKRRIKESFEVLCSHVNYPIIPIERDYYYEKYKPPVLNLTWESRNPGMIRQRYNYIDNNKYIYPKDKCITSRYNQINDTCKGDLFQTDYNININDNPPICKFNCAHLNQLPLDLKKQMAY